MNIINNILEYIIEKDIPLRFLLSFMLIASIAFVVIMGMQLFLILFKIEPLSIREISLLTISTSAFPSLLLTFFPKD